MGSASAAAQPVRDHQRHGAFGHPGQHGDELVAAEPGEQVARSKLGHEALGGHPYRVVPHPVAVAVVDQLETVEVEEAHGDGRLAGGAEFGESLAEHLPVRQPGQLIVQRPAQQLPFRSTGRGDVVVDRDRPQVLAVLADDRLGRHLDGAHRAGAVDHGQLSLAHGLAVMRPAQRRLMCPERPSVRAEELGGSQIDVGGRQRRLDPVEQPGRLVDHRGETEGVGGDHSVVELVQHRGEEAALVVEAVGQLEVPVTGSQGDEHTADGGMRRQIAAGDLHPLPAARAMTDPQHHPVDLGAQGDPLEGFERGDQVVGVDQISSRAANELCGGPADHPRHRGVGEGDREAGVEHQNGVAQVLDHRRRLVGAGTAAGTAVVTEWGDAAELRRGQPGEAVQHIGDVVLDGAVATDRQCSNHRAGPAPDGDAQAFAVGLECAAGTNVLLRCGQWPGLEDLAVQRRHHHRSLPDEGDDVDCAADKSGGGAHNFDEHHVAREARRQRGAQ